MVVGVSTVGVYVRGNEQACYVVRENTFLIDEDSSTEHSPTVRLNTKSSRIHGVFAVYLRRPYAKVGPYLVPRNFFSAFMGEPW